MMSGRYIVQRSTSDKQVHLIYYDDNFTELPDEVRQRGPWQILQHGSIDRLKLKYQARLARHGYVLEITPVPVFRPEA
jgi:hypothetical protein